MAAAGCQRDHNIVIIKVGKTHVLKKEEFLFRIESELRGHNALSMKGSKTLFYVTNKVSNDFIKEALVQRWAKKKNFFISTKQLEDHIEAVKKQYGGDALFFQFLKKNKISFPEWRKRVKNSLLEQKLFQELAKNLKPIPKKELLSYYKKNKSQFRRNERVKIQQIQSSSSKDLNLLLRKIKTGLSFEKALKKSTANTKPFWVIKPYVGPFSRAFSMRVGQISRVVKSDFGYHIFKVLKKRRARPSYFNEEKEKIKQRLKTQKLQALFSLWLKNQMENTKVFQNQKAIESLRLRLL